MTLFNCKVIYRCISIINQTFLNLNKLCISVKHCFFSCMKYKILVRKVGFFSITSSRNHFKKNQIV